MKVSRLVVVVFMSMLLIVMYCSAKTCDRSCKISKAHRMLMADCYHLELKEFPCVREDVEVIDVSLNRIRRLDAEDLQQFSSLRMLYLMENMITRIDEHAFLGQDDLEVLDLTMNSFSTLPTAIFELPSLRRLLLGQNENANIVEIIESVERIASPLEYLDLSYNRMERLPVLSALPKLLLYNISGHENLEMNTSNFAAACNLIEILNDNVTYRFNDPCDCWVLMNWLLKRNIRFKNFHCEEFIDFEDGCDDKQVPSKDLEVFESCKEAHVQMLHQIKLLNIVVPIVAVVALLFLVVVLVLILRRRKRAKAARAWQEHHLHDEAKDSLNKHSL